MAKGSNIMSNRQYTSDMVGGCHSGLAIGSHVGSHTGSHVGAHLAIGRDSLYVGRDQLYIGEMAAERDRKGGDVMNNKRRTSDMTGGYDIIGRASEKELRIAAASVRIDKRIYDALSSGYARAYEKAISAESAEEYALAANAVLLGMLSDTGVAGTVKSVPAVAAEFGGLGLFQRAVYRRLREKRKAVGG